ncbi:MAG: glycoside hydrolase family 13 [Chloroflexi bacterium]|jgi:1,4-alpha-glucan branching enzyme|nr:glycoside hydrolase family 13 [Chloroflexota bacterium]
MITKGNASKPDKLRVTFRLPSSIWAETVHLVGDFNGWNRQSHPLDRTAEGSWEITLELDRGRMYQFRYLVNGTDWQNDWNADRYIPNPFGGENSVLET